MIKKTVVSVRDLKNDKEWKEVIRKRNVRQNGYRISNAQMTVLLLSLLCCLFKGGWIIPAFLWGYYIWFFISSGFKDKREEIVTEQNLRNGMGGELYIQQAKEVLGSQKVEEIVQEKLEDARARFYKSVDKDYDWSAYHDILKYTTQADPESTKALRQWVQIQCFEKYLDLAQANFMQLYPKYKMEHPGKTYEQLKKYWNADVRWARNSIYTAVERRLEMYIYGKNYCGLSEEGIHKSIEQWNSSFNAFNVPVGDFIRDNIYNNIE